MIGTAVVEVGIGATRALILDDLGQIVAAHIERDDGGPRAGSEFAGRLVAILVPRQRGIARAGTSEFVVEPLPPQVTEGAPLRLRVTREAIAETGRPRLAKAIAISGATAAAGALAPGPDLRARLVAAGLKIVAAAGPGEDRLEAAGWSETVESALTGHVAFAGGLLTICPTPAMTLIDVDGPGAAEALAAAATIAAARTIARFDITGSVGIDLPTLAGKGPRARIGALLDAHLPQPFERTAINGFGFVQIVRPRLRASFVEAVRAPGFTSLELLRRAARGAPGARTLVAHPSVIDWLAARPGLIAALASRCGGAIGLRADASATISGSHVTLG